MKIKPGAVRAGLEVYKDITRRFVNGLVATDGAQYSAVVTFGTAPTEIINTLFDPGFNVGLQEIEVRFLNRFTGQNGSFVGSINWYWQIRSEAAIPSGGAPVKFTGDWVNVTGTYQESVPTLLNLDGTLSGYIPVGTIPYAPIRARLMAVGIQAAVSTGRVKNDSFLRIVGNVIPGT